MTATFESFQRIRAGLERGGFPGPLAWWDVQFRRFYESGAKRLATRVGRGGAKSTSMVDGALNEVVCGDWTIPLGEIHYFAFVSQNKAEAGQRLRQIAARLRALGIPFDQRDDEIVLRDMPRGFRVFACQVGAVSGFRCFGFCADELAKWTNADHSANPAHEVVASLRAMTVTHPGAREFFVSSPMGTDDLHYEIIEAGDSAEQVVAIAATWVANTTVSEAETRRLEPDPDVWLREYAAQPSNAVSSAFVGSDVAACFGDHPGYYFWGEPLWAIDSSETTNTFAAIGFCWGRPDHEPRFKRLAPPPGSGLGSDVFVGWELDAYGNKIPEPTAERPLLRVFSAVGWDADALARTPMEQVVAELAHCVRSSGADTVLSDLYGARFVAALLSHHRVKLRAFTTTNATINDAVGLLRTLMRDRQLSIAHHEQLERDLYTYPRTISGGLIRYGKRRSGGKHHWDYASCMVTMAHGLLEERGQLVTDTHFNVENAPTRRHIGGRQTLPGR